MKIDCVRCPACRQLVRPYSLSKTRRTVRDKDGNEVLDPDPKRRYWFDMEFSCSCGTNMSVRGGGIATADLSELMWRQDDDYVERAKAEVGGKA